MSASNGQNQGFQPGRGMMQGSNTGFNSNPYQPQYQPQYSSPMTNMGPTQANGYPKYQFYGNPQYDMQMPWMNNFRQQGTQQPMQQQTTMQSMNANSYNTPRPGMAGNAASSIANMLPQQQSNQNYDQAYQQSLSQPITGSTVFQSASPAAPKPIPNYAANPSPLGVDDIRARLFASTGGSVTPAATDFYRSQFLTNPDGSQYSVSTNGDMGEFGKYPSMY